MAGQTAMDSANPALKTSSKSSTAHFCSLKNDVHAIFCRSNFTHGIDYDMVLPAIQLASRLISRPTPLSIWHAIFFSELFRIRQVVRPQDEEHFEFTDFSENLSEEQVRKTEAALIDLADKIRFATFEVPQSENWSLDVLRSENKTVIIRISTEKVAELQNAATKCAEGNDNDAEYILRCFMLAKDLVHELTHAASHFRDDANFYFPMSSIAEEGFEWEAQLFGGLVHLETIPPHMANPRKSFQAFITPWPNIKHVGLYLLNDHRIGIRLRHAAVFLDGDKDSGYRCNVASYISTDFVRQIFTDKFWTHDVVEHGAVVLQPQVDKDEYIVRNVDPDRFRALARVYLEARDGLKEQLRNVRSEMQQKVGGVFEVWDDFVQDWQPES